MRQPRPYSLSFSLMMITLCVMSIPVLAGIIGVLLPAFGYFPALGYQTFSFEPLRLFLAHPGALQAISSALFVGLTASLLSVFCVFVILAAGTQAGLGRHVMRFHRRLMGPLIALPHSTVAIALLFLLAPSGWLVRLISPEMTGWMRPPAYGFVPDQTGWLLVIGLMAKEIPFLLLIALAQSQRLAIGTYQNLGHSFGYHAVVSWLFVIWPQIYAQMRLPILAVLAYSLSVVDMALILGPGLPPPLAVLVLQGFHDADLHARLPASAGAMLQIAVIAIGFIIWRLAERWLLFLSHYALAQGWRLRLLPIMVQSAFYIITSAFLMLCLGIFAIVLWAFATSWSFRSKFPSGLSFHHWSFEGAFGVIIFDTIIIALLASVISVMLCAFWLEHIKDKPTLIHLITTLLFVPLFVPQISLLFGLQVALSASYLDGYLATVIFAHCLYIMPYIWLLLAPAYQAYDVRYHDIAEMMGYRGVRLFLALRLPILGHSFGSALILGVAVSIALYLPSIFAGAGQITTLTMEAVTLAGNGARQPAAQSALMQMVIPCMAFILIRGALSLRFSKFKMMQSHPS